MSEEYNNAGSTNENGYSQPQYSQAPSGNQYSYNNYNNNYGGYGGGPLNDYGSGKGQGKGLGIASMVCGILSIVTICCLGSLYSLYGSIPIILGIAGVVLGIVQIVKNESRGMAIAGIVCGAVGIVFSVISLIALLSLNSMGLDANELLRQLEGIENSLVIYLK